MAWETWLGGYRLLSPRLNPKLLTVRDSENTNAQEHGNNNGHWGPEIDQEGSRRHRASTEGLPLSPSPPPTSPPILTPPSPGAASSSSTSSTLSTFSISTSSPVYMTPLTIVTSTAISSISSVISSTPSSSIVIFTTPNIGTSGEEISTSATSLVSVPSSSGLVLFTTSSEEMTLHTTFTSVSSTCTTTPTQPWMVSSAPNGTFHFESKGLSPGQRAGISIAAIAGSAFSLAVILFLIKRYKIKPPETLRHIFSKFAGSCGLFRGKTTNTQHGRVLEAEVNPNNDTYWDYRETFARPTVIQRARQSLHKSLTGLRRINPLDMNPVRARTWRVGTPSRSSFSSISFSSIFRRRSVVSTHPSISQVSLFADRSGRASVPPSPPPLPPIPPLYNAFQSARSSSMSGQSIGHVQDNMEVGLSPINIPPPVLKSTRNHTISQVISPSIESKANSINYVPGWKKFHLPRKLQSGVVISQEFEKPLPPAPLPTSPGIWLETQETPGFLSDKERAWI